MSGRSCNQKPLSSDQGAGRKSKSRGNNLRSLRSLGVAWVKALPKWAYAEPYHHDLDSLSIRSHTIVTDNQLEPPLYKKTRTPYFAPFQTSVHCTPRTFTHSNPPWLQYYIPVVPGQAGGGSFRGKKNYTSKQEFHYRMCVRRPTMQGDAQTFFAVNEPFAVPWWWCDMFRCHEVACGWDEVMWLVVRWRGVSYCG